MCGKENPSKEQLTGWYLEGKDEEEYYGLDCPPSFIGPCPPESARHICLFVCHLLTKHNFFVSAIYVFVLKDIKIEYIVKSNYDLFVR